MRETVENDYGTVLSDSTDPRTAACATSAAPSGSVRRLIDNVRAAAARRDYGIFAGCGTVLPDSRTPIAAAGADASACC